VEYDFPLPVAQRMRECGFLIVSVSSATYFFLFWISPMYHFPRIAGWIDSFPEYTPLLFRIFCLMGNIFEKFPDIAVFSELISVMSPCPKNWSTWDFLYLSGSVGIYFLL